MSTPGQEPENGQAKGRVTIRQLPTGVPGLDEILGGGLPEFSFNIIAGAPGCGKTTLAHQIMFANATPERPALYRLKLTVRAAGANFETTAPVGFRQIEVKGTKILLNGEAVFFKGVNYHEMYPGVGMTLSRERAVSGTATPPSGSRGPTISIVSDGSIATSVPAAAMTRPGRPQRERVVLAHRRGTRMVHTRVEVQEQTEVGDALVRGLVRAQLGLALRLAAVVAGVMAALPLLNTAFPELAAVTVFGMVITAEIFLPVQGCGRRSGLGKFRTEVPFGQKTLARPLTLGRRFPIRAGCRR